MRTSIRALCAAFALVLLLAVMPQAVRAETLAEKIARLKGEIAAIGTTISGYEDDIANAQALAQSYQTEQALIQELLDACRQNIAQTEAQLEQKQAEIAEKRQVIYDNEELFQERLVAIYKMNNGDIMSTLLNVNTFSELNAVIDSIRRISQHDTELLDMLAGQKAALEAEYAALDELLAAYNEQSAEFEDSISMLAGNIAAQNAAISQAEALKAAQEDALGDTQEALKAAQAEQAAIANSVNNTGSNSSDGSSYNGGQFYWPVQGFYNVSCEYGSPDPNGTPHRGMDIAGGGISGAAISAVADGTVIIASYAHSSYGNYVVVDHGGGLKTLYAHCASLSVSVGQGVSRGATIGTVGSTGFSTGYHLHLEVHLNGSLQNPRSYFA